MKTTYYETLGEVCVPQSEVAEGLTIYTPELQEYTTEQIRAFAEELGTELPEYTTREDALEFLAWWIQGDIIDAD